MINVVTHNMVGFLKFYVIAVLVTAIVVAPLSALIAPVLLLIWYLYSWRWHISDVIDLLTDYFIFFIIPLLLVLQLPPLFAFMVSLPVLYLVNNDLERTTRVLAYRDIRYRRIPTNVALTLLGIAVLMLVVSLLLSSTTMLLSFAAAMAYLGVLGIIIWKGLPLKPVKENVVQQRMVAGSTESLDIKLSAQTRLGGLLFVQSPHEWLKVSPSVLSLKDRELSLRVTLTPTLSGPWSVKLNGLAVDRWGLTQSKCELEPIALHVIPRARYAAWLARKYLAETKAGTVPVFSETLVSKLPHLLRRGVEYAGSEPYQPGDSLKYIDWKRSSKYEFMITKQFAEFHAQSAIVLANLSVSDAEEADQLAYYLLVTALSLARENIPTALATYDHTAVRLATQALSPRQLVLQALQAARKIVIYVDPARCLQLPDASRLRADITRLRSVKSETASRLIALLQWEYGNLRRAAKLNPATTALAEASAKIGKDAAVVVISCRNHDAEAIAFDTFDLTSKGIAVINVELR